ncbi:DUF6128 domain-containing protein [Lachnotalea glycerini]|uniref:DUF6128 domain-containing protein n=1 Tax=Lachnotalea glycerini TaxID=1763509 RepID=A0A371JB67_9FIRM|nr:DUF6128 domain-containing protein [Lachnotalea glycerini]RDY29907.1 hypothetical protein CG710_017385 [Lachnotalea glycerini]
MSEYQRLVSYIYLYDKGIKVKNSGFAKIECKDNTLRIKMNLKGIFNNYYDNWKVYLLIERNKELLGIYIGDVKGKGSNAEFQTSCQQDNIGNTSQSFEDIIGLAVISSGNKKYATFWKDTNITVDNFKEYEEKTIAEKINTGLEKIFNINHTKETKEELVTAMAVETEEENKIEQTVNTEKEKLVECEKENLRKNEIEEINLNENWDKLISQFKIINSFSDKEVECIRIELKDLKILPKSQWILSNNSFVLHGYYNYKYLILGKINNRFIIGVPGVFCNKEKLVAGIFGFNDFKPAQVSEYKTGRFGYWYKYL